MRSGGKSLLWDELLKLKSRLGGAWCFMGDFNAVRRESERYEGLSGTRKMSEFNDY